MQCCMCKSARAERQVRRRRSQASPAGFRRGSTQETMVRDTAEQLAETRARLLDAVLETLAECGYAATTTNEVARRSGLTRGAQLHHFGTKEQMIIAAVEHLN